MYSVVLVSKSKHFYSLNSIFKICFNHNIWLFTICVIEIMKVVIFNDVFLIKKKFRVKKKSSNMWNSRNRNDSISFFCLKKKRAFDVNRSIQFPNKILFSICYDLLYFTSGMFNALRINKLIGLHLNWIWNAILQLKSADAQIT